MDFSNVSKKGKKICSLWAGYGSIYRIPFEKETAIVKHIQSVFDSSISTVRKMKSYKNECLFYSTVLEMECRIPKYISHQIDNENIYLAMEDLDEFPNKLGDLDKKALELALEWLAQFHAFHWNSKKYALEGGYWYLSTRREEWSQIPKKFQKLKDNAELIDEKCKDERFMTIVHGDTKSENIQFNRDYSKCAFVDFQYTGQGLGAKDVAYLICSSASQSLLSTDWFLDFYFEKLQEYCYKYEKNMNGYTLELFKEHFDWCLLDFLRFLSGWGMWGHTSWALKRVSSIL